MIISNEKKTNFHLCNVENIVRISNNTSEIATMVLINKQQKAKLIWTFESYLIKNPDAKMLMCCDMYRIDRYHDFSLYLICCFTSTINSRGHVRTVSYLTVITTLLLGKPPGGSLTVFKAHSFASNWQLALCGSAKECAGCQVRSQGHLHTKCTRYRPSYHAKYFASWGVYYTIST